MNDMPFVAANDVLNNFWDGFLPIDPRKLAEAMGAQVVADLSLAIEGISGSFEYDVNGRPLIKYNPTEPLVRQRFTIAHELGHMAMAHVVPGEKAHRDTTGSYTMDKRQPKEVEANRFAAQILMPAEVVRLMRRMAGGSNVASTMASEFKVSEAAMNFRLNNLGL